MIETMKKTITHRVPSSARAFHSHVVSITAYFACLYYLEIILFMFNAVLIFGKTPSVIAGLVFSVMLTRHILSLYAARNTSRVILLFIMDIHVAVTISFIPGLWVFNIGLNAITSTILVVRSIMLLLEVPLIYLLTDTAVIKQYVGDRRPLL